MPQKMHYIPWEQVTANTLRNVCRDLGLVGHSHSRDEMRRVLQDVESRGCEFRLVPCVNKLANMVYVL